MNDQHSKQAEVSVLWCIPPAACNIVHNWSPVKFSFVYVLCYPLYIFYILYCYHTVRVYKPWVDEFVVQIIWAGRNIILSQFSNIFALKDKLRLSIIFLCYEAVRNYSSYSILDMGAIETIYRNEFFMMTSANRKIFRVTSPLWFTGHRWIPLTKAINAELWCFLWSASERTVK